jgi:GR25 family glycosyltransferase involved in LPS biosynthesis
MLSTIQNWLRDVVRAGARPRVKRAPADMMHYWINPDGESDRAQWMRSEFDKTGVHDRRVPACTPATLPPLHLPVRHDASKLQLACLCSHLAAIEHGLEGGEDMFMVVEDDIVQAFSVDFGQLVDHAPADWEILQLYVVNADRLQAMYTRSYLRGRLWERWKEKNHSTGAYLCSRDGARKLLARFRRGASFDLRGHKGALVADELLYRTVGTYTLTYPLYIENDAFDSTLNSLRRLHVSSHEVIRRIWSDSASPGFATRVGAARSEV